MPIVVNDVIVHVEPDSGADVNVMDERQHGALRRETYENITLKASNTKLSTLQNELKVSDQFKGNKFLLKKRQINKWSTFCEKECHEIIEIHGSTVEARRR